MRNIIITDADIEYDNEHIIYEWNTKGKNSIFKIGKHIPVDNKNQMFKTCIIGVNDNFIQDVKDSDYVVIDLTKENYLRDLPVFFDMYESWHAVSKYDVFDEDQTLIDLDDNVDEDGEEYICIMDGGMTTNSYRYFYEIAVDLIKMVLFKYAKNVHIIIKDGEAYNFELCESYFYVQEAKLYQANIRDLDCYNEYDEPEDYDKYKFSSEYTHGKVVNNIEVLNRFLKPTKYEQETYMDIYERYKNEIDTQCDEELFNKYLRLIKMDEYNEPKITINDNIDNNSVQIKSQFLYDDIIYNNLDRYIEYLIEEGYIYSVINNIPKANSDKSNIFYVKFVEEEETGPLFSCMAINNIESIIEAKLVKEYDDFIQESYMPLYSIQPSFEDRLKELEQKTKLEYIERQNKINDKYLKIINNCIKTQDKINADINNFYYYIKNIKNEEESGNIAYEEDHYEHLLNKMILKIPNIDILMADNKYKETENYFIQRHSESIWNKLKQDSKSFLVTSRIIYNNINEYGDKLDFSCVCLPITKALENEFNKYLFSGLKEFLISNNVEIQDWSEGVKEYNKRSGKYVEKRDFTLGSIKYTALDKNGSINKYFKKYCNEAIFAKNNTLENDEYIKELVMNTEYIRKEYRNKIAHKEPIKIQDANNCYNYIISTEKVLINFIKRLDNSVVLGD